MELPRRRLTINISLTPELADFARADSAAGAFDRMSEYMRELLREWREAKIAADVVMREKAITGAPAGDRRKAELRQLHDVAKKGRRK